MIVEHAGIYLSVLIFQFRIQIALSTHRIAVVVAAENRLLPPPFANVLICSFLLIKMHLIILLFLLSSGQVFIIDRSAS